MTDTPYRVLARAYRPQSFDDLIGQEVLVRTLTNAFASGRIAHAFLLTGIRGIGKTTTARIIARGLNCTGPDGNGGPTTSPCGECPNCKMILEDRHVDVIETDAASRTGVDDMRDLIETVHYAPTSARYKVYIIDEVHMLSKSAFNALLKTLEEPPAHVKFIFATTELHKIPVTIVSRCQRFDLRRVDLDVLAGHLKNIATKESVSIDEESLQLIATAAEGSVRDALSLLDQAIALESDSKGSASIGEAVVRNMLGLADKTRAFALLEAAFEGKAKEAMDVLREIYANGGDPVLLTNDLLEMVHFMTRIRLESSLAHNVHYSETEQEKAKALAAKLDMVSLTRAWQMLLKGLSEIKQAPSPLAAAEMLLVRLSYSSTLPSPAEIIKQIKSGAVSDSTPPPPGGGRAPAQTMIASAPVRGNLALAPRSTPAPESAPVARAQPQELASPESYREVVALFEAHREPILHSHLFNDVRLVSFEVGRLELHPVSHLPADFAARAGRCLFDWTGQRWSLTFSDANGEPSLYEQAQKEQEQLIAYVSAHPNVQKVMELFPGAEVIEVHKAEDDA